MQETYNKINDDNVNTDNAYIAVNFDEDNKIDTRRKWPTLMTNNGENPVVDIPIIQGVN